MVYATVGQRTGEEEEVESELDSDGGKEGSADMCVTSVLCVCVCVMSVLCVWM